jgi:hypothetical protein
VQRGKVGQFLSHRIRYRLIAKFPDGDRTPLGKQHRFMCNRIV